MARFLLAAYNPCRPGLLRFMRKLFARLFVLFGLLLQGGCAWFDHPEFHTPRWRSPGPAFYQQHHAVRHDPYPQNDLGPEVVGGRPRAYQQPQPEVTRLREYQPGGNLRGNP